MWKVTLQDSATRCRNEEQVDAHMWRKEEAWGHIPALAEHSMCAHRYPAQPASSTLPLQAVTWRRACSARGALLYSNRSRGVVCGAQLRLDLFKPSWQPAGRQSIYFWGPRSIAAAQNPADNSATDLIHKQMDFQSTADFGGSNACDGQRPNRHGDLRHELSTYCGERIRVLQMTKNRLE
jgi:hypothetical protein